mmetsp:Transcript_20454/g.31169  ORF Transcript_20454/g.31169 Transcript_20454/m.31169 type:complete len:183 (-) Transcript_20454:124-672(-)
MFDDVSILPLCQRDHNHDFPHQKMTSLFLKQARNHSVTCNMARRHCQSFSIKPLGYAPSLLTTFAISLGSNIVYICPCNPTPKPGIPKRMNSPNFCLNSELNLYCLDIWSTGRPLCWGIILPTNGNVGTFFKIGPVTGHPDDLSRWMVEVVGIRRDLPPPCPMAAFAVLRDNIILSEVLANY